MSTPQTPLPRPAPEARQGLPGLALLHGQPTGNFIAGQWQAAREGTAPFAVTNPASGDELARAADSTAADARAAVDAAHAALAGWKKTPAKQRAALLRHWHDLVLAQADALGALISAEQGKPAAEGRGEVAYAASYIAWFAEEATRMNGDVIPAPVPGRRLFALREPVGVVAAITPWNFPAAMIARKIAPALAAGCTIVCKPAEDTPLTALALARLAQDAGIPPGVLNVLTASRARTPEVVDAWLNDTRVRKLSFTGSTPIGKHLARRSADTLKKLSLELGGNAPFIVFDDADLDAAVQGLMVAKFRNGGQTCVCPNRVFVQAGVHEDFVARLAARVAALKVGPASDPASDIGPLINERAVEKVERHLQDAVQRGATVRTGGQRLAGLGPNYFAPTVVCGATADMACSQEETFGPLLPITRFETEAEVLDAANATPFGLAAYFYSQDVRRIWRLAEALETGMVGVNEGSLAAEAAPFGGVKESGYGREGSIHGLDDYLQIKYVCQGGLDP